MSDELVTELWAYLGPQPADGTDGIVVGMLPQIGPAVLVAAARSIAELMEPFAREAAERRGLKVRLVRLVVAETVKEILRDGAC